MYIISNATFGYNMEFPVDYSVITKITICKIIKVDITLFEKANITVIFFTESGGGSQTQYLVMDTSNGYNEWNNDDSFLVEWVKRNITPPK
jgi:hypothetical protein